MVSQKCGAAVLDLRDQVSRVRRFDVQMLRCELVGQFAGVLLIANQNQCPKCFQTVDRQIISLQQRDLADQFIVDRLDHRLVPGDQDRAAG